MSKSRIFLFFCLSFIFGVFVQSLINVPKLLWLGILIFGIVLASLFWERRKNLVIAGFCLIVLVGGIWRFDGAAGLPTLPTGRQAGQAGGENSIRQFNGKGRIIFQAIVVEEPDVRADNIKYKISAVSIKPFDSAYSLAQGINVNQDLYPERSRRVRPLGDVLVVTKKYPAYRYGDKLEITGKLQTPKSSEDFDYQKYLAKDDIYSVVYYPEIKLLASGQGSWLMEKLLAVKNKFKDSISRILTEPQGAFLAGLLLGEKRGLPADLADAFSRTGTTHIIALSGYNITIIAVSLIALFNFFMLRRSVSFWAAISVIVLFVMMTGAAASAVRAAIMGILVLIATQSGRLYSIRNALVFAGAVMVWLNPKVLVFDLGFQLSFAATLGLLYISPILQKRLEREDEKDLPKSWLGLKGILIATLSAQIAVLPLLVINFGQLSIIAPLANLAVLPFIPLTMLLGFLGAALGIFWNIGGAVLGWLAWLFLTYEIKIIELLAKIPPAAVKFKWNWLGGTIYYAILIWFVWRINRKINVSEN